MGKKLENIEIKKCEIREFEYETLKSKQIKSIYDEMNKKYAGVDFNKEMEEIYLKFNEYNKMFFQKLLIENEKMKYSYNAELETVQQVNISNNFSQLSIEEINKIWFKSQLKTEIFLTKISLDNVKTRLHYTIA